MAGDAGFLAYVMELLAPLGDVTSRAMFGGYGIFEKGDMFALISGSRLYFKVDDSNRPAYENASSEQFAPMPYYEVPAEVLENAATLHEWASTSMAIGHATARKKKRK